MIMQFVSINCLVLTFNLEHVTLLKAIYNYASWESEEEKVDNSTEAPKETVIRISLMKRSCGL